MRYRPRLLAVALLVACDRGVPPAPSNTDPPPCAPGEATLEVEATTWDPSEGCAGRPTTLTFDACYWAAYAPDAPNDCADLEVSVFAIDTQMCVVLGNNCRSHGLTYQDDPAFESGSEHGCAPPLDICQ